MGIRTTAGMVKIGAAVVGVTSGLFLALVATASPAGADPTLPPPPAPPAPLENAAVQSAGADAAPPEGVPHLASPDALPPGSTMDPSVKGDESPNVSYLKDLFHAVQNQEISGREAVLYGLAQRGMNKTYPDQAPGPNVPISSGDPALAPQPPPAPAPPPPPAPAPLLP